MSAPEAAQNLRPINEAISEYLMASVGFEHQFESMLEDLEQLRAELIGRARDVHKQQRETSEKDRRLIDELREQLAEVQQERDELRFKLDETICQGSHISDELRKFRALMVKQAKLMIGNAQPRRPKQPEPSIEQLEAATADPVALAVMAQLSSLNPADDRGDFF